MNYKKLYEESLEKAKQGLPIDEVFPELKDSEDERIRKALVKTFEKKLEIGFEWTEFGIPNRSVLDWLEKQKEQKSAKWSKEDEYKLNFLTEMLEGLDHREFDTRYMKELSSWLKSLRSQPHWKPSEEQMSSLEHFIRAWGESGSMSPQNPVLCAAKSLLTDLQKLL